MNIPPKEFLHNGALHRIVGDTRPADNYFQNSKHNLLQIQRTRKIGLFKTTSWETIDEEEVPDSARIAYAATGDWGWVSRLFTTYPQALPSHKAKETPMRTSLAIARELDLVGLNAKQSTTHEAMANAQLTAQADVIDALLGKMGISPEQALSRLRERQSVDA